MLKFTFQLILSSTSTKDENITNLQKILKDKNVVKNHTKYTWED